MTVMRLWAQVGGSCLVVAGVLWFMWRLPRRGNSYFVFAPWMSLGSVWGGLLAVAATSMLWWVRFPDAWLVALLLVVDPATVAAGILVLWFYRGPMTAQEDQAVAMARQRQQAVVGIALGILAVALAYIYVMTHKRPFTTIGL